MQPYTICFIISGLCIIGLVVSLAMIVPVFIFAMLGIAAMPDRK